MGSREGERKGGCWPSTRTAENRPVGQGGGPGAPTPTYLGLREETRGPSFLSPQASGCQWPSFKNTEEHRSVS